LALSSVVHGAGTLSVVIFRKAGINHMNNVARKGLVTAMVAGGVLASAGYAQADSAAEGDTAGSPGVLSGNSVQVPVNVPVNVCGNTISVVGLLNPVMGNVCANQSGGAASGATAGNTSSAAAFTAHRASTGARPARHAGPAADESRLAGSAGHAAGQASTDRAAGSESQSGGGAHAEGRSTGSPGLLSGNELQLPLHLPVNVSGNSLNVVGIGNPAFGNTAVNGDAPAPPATPTPVPAPPAHAPIPAPPNPATSGVPAAAPTLAHTGADGLGYAAGSSAALLGGGVLLYRRFRPGRG
jgi:hypothetical protein